MIRTKEVKRLSPLEYGLILLVFCVCLTGALLIPINQCPDEAGRKLVSDWIATKKSLPTGDEWQTTLMLWENSLAPVGIIRADAEIAGWGFSYALRPFLTAILAALFMDAAAQLTASPRILLAASRMGSVLSLTLCCVYCLRLGRRLFARRSSAVLLAAFICFMPQVMFLGMYQNNDILSLCAVGMMLYYWVEGYDCRWPVKSCVGIGVAFSVGLLSYYSIYGWILMCAVFCVLAVLTDPDISDKRRLILRRTALIAGICLALAGWFFVRNAILHDGDFLGIASEEVSRTRMRQQGYKLYDYICRRAEGMSIPEFLRFRDHEWFRMSAQSFIGVFGYMLLYLPRFQYGIYCAVIGFGVLLCCAVLLRRRPDRRHGLLLLLMLFSGAITVFLHFWQSYARDYQPQGRYIITLILPLAYMLAYGLDKTTVTVQNPRPGKAAELSPAAVLTALWLALFVWAALGTMTKMLP